MNIALIDSFLEMDLVCDLISYIVGEPSETVYGRLKQELCKPGGHATFAEFRRHEGPRIDRRIVELMAPLAHMPGESRMAYIEEILCDAWSGRNDKSLIDAVFLAWELLEQGYVTAREREPDDEATPPLASVEYDRSEEGGADDWDCADCYDSSEDEDTFVEEIQEILDELVEQGLVEWEWHSASDGTLEKMYRVKLH